jgi:hypothetical protein
MSALICGDSAIPVNLLAITTARESTHPNGGPAQLAHLLREPPASASATVALWDFQDVEHGLRGDALDAIVTNFTVQPFQGQVPRINRGRSLGTLNVHLLNFCIA